MRPVVAQKIDSPQSSGPLRGPLFPISYLCFVSLTALFVSHLKKRLLTLWAELPCFLRRFFFFFFFFFFCFLVSKSGRKEGYTLSRRLRTV